MSVVVAAVVTTGVSMGVSAWSNHQASKAQAQANQNALNAQTAQYQQQREDLRPWRETGEKYLNLIQQGLEAGDFDPSNFQFEEDPGYQFRLNQGVDQIKQQSRAGGTFGSGAYDKALIRYNQDYASNEYDKAYDRNRIEKQNKFNQMGTLAQTGQVATNTGVSASQHYGNTMAQGYQNQGQISANKYNTYGDIMNQGASNAFMAATMNK